jgi:FAD/FMN-containing dehydrogenase/Fe-S oxidoreductase
MHLGYHAAIAALDRFRPPTDDGRMAPMDAPARPPVSSRIGDSALAARLAREIEGEVLFDAFSRGRYSTDASIYQIEPIGVVVPRTETDVERAIAIAVDEKIPILPRGGGSSQCGQTVGEALIIDTSKHLDRVIDFDAGARTVTVQPGVVLDQLNAFLRPHGVFFPVDPSTSAQATIGGMTANNSAGARSIRYGIMVDSVRAIEAILADGSTHRFAETPADMSGGEAGYGELVGRLRAIAEREAGEIAARFPKLLRRVGGYNIDTLSAGGHNMAKLLVGSEGTLGFFKRIELDLQPILPHRVLGVCHFERFHDAMEMSRHIVELEPTAVELVDSTMIELARDIPIYRVMVERFVRGDPGAILVVEFASDDADDPLRRLARLGELMADHGHPNAVLEAIDPALQSDIVEVRKAGLNIMMSMKSAGKPVSFIEDCAVPLEDLAEYTARLNDVFARNGVEGTWYAHASVGCLHVRPVLDMREEGDVAKMRAIAEEAFAMVREYKGSHSGEHGDGLVRSEFHAEMFGERIAGAFAEVKRCFDPDGLFNPGKIVDPPRMDDRALFRFKPGYRTDDIDTALDWSAWRGFAGAVEMCNNNGECRKATGGVMCPSFRVTGDEAHVTRGRANTLRLALSGQLGPDALASDELAATMELCIGCKGCRRECPTGVDMSRMKIEAAHQRNKRHGIARRQRLFAYLPRYAPWASRLWYFLNLRDRLPGMAGLSEMLLGVARKRRLPRWRSFPFRGGMTVGEGDAGEVVLLVDTFSTWFEPEVAHAALAVLVAADYRVHLPRAADGKRPLCCGRTFLSSGLIDEARQEARRTLAALAPYIEKGTPIIGLEPSCLMTLRDEYTVMSLGEDADRLADLAVMFEEFIAVESDAGRLALQLKPVERTKALIHGHCHQKAFAAVGATEKTLQLIPGLEVETIASGCCGMAGSFGYEAEHYDVSMKMAELDLLPAARESTDEIAIVADGTSCRHQIRDGADREAVHAAVLLDSALIR